MVAAGLLERRLRERNTDRGRAVTSVCGVASSGSEAPGELAHSRSKTEWTPAATNG